MTSAVLPAMMRAIVVASCLAGLFGCSSTTTGSDDAPPRIEITSPARGTFVEGSSVEVTGKVTDDKSGVRALINGTEVVPAADGSFTTTVTVTTGISIIESHAIDSANNDTRDVRAVMAGTLATADGSMASPLGARVGTQGFDKIGSALAITAKAIDFKAAAMAMNPVYRSSGCNSATINVENLTLSNIAVKLVPQTGKLNAGVDITNVNVQMHANFRAVCISGSTTIKVHASMAHVKGDLAVAVAGGKLATTLPAATVTLDGFTIDIGGVPGVLENLIKGEARKAVENALTTVIKDKVPKLANDTFAGLLAKPVNADVLGHTLSLSAVPKQVQLSADGLFVAVDTKVKVEGGEGGMFVASPSPMSASLMPTTGVGLAVADDTLNQLFSGLWAAGAIDQELKLDGQLAVLSALLDDDAASLRITAALPPTVAGDADALHLTIGDLMLSVKDANGTEIQNIALSVKTTLEASPTQTGAITLTVGQPTLFAQVISQNEEVDRPMTDEQFEGIINGAWGLIGSQADTALAGLTMPSLAGVTLGAPSLEGRSGYVVADIPVE